MKSVSQRLNNIVGQINGVQKMISKQADCLDVLTQLKATKSAINSVMETMIDNQFDTCLQQLNTRDKELLIKIKKYVRSD